MVSFYYVSKEFIFQEWNTTLLTCKKNYPQQFGLSRRLSDNFSKKENRFGNILGEQCPFSILNKSTKNKEQILEDRQTELLQLNYLKWF